MSRQTVVVTGTGSRRSQVNQRTSSCIRCPNHSLTTISTDMPPSRRVLAAVKLIDAAMELCDHVTATDPIELELFLKMKYPELSNQIIRLVTASINYQIASL